jgi:hypothetical protein
VVWPAAARRCGGRATAAPANTVAAGLTNRTARCQAPAPAAARVLGLGAAPRRRRGTAARPCRPGARSGRPRDARLRRPVLASLLPMRGERPGPGGTTPGAQALSSARGHPGPAVGVSCRSPACRPIAAVVRVAEIYSGREKFAVGSPRASPRPHPRTIRPAISTRDPRAPTLPGNTAGPRRQICGGQWSAEGAVNTK